MKYPVPEIVENFLNYKEVNEGRSENTIEGYNSDLYLFCTFYKEKYNKEIDFLTLTADEIDSFIYNMKDCKNSSKARRISALRSLFEYLIIKDKRLDNPMLKIKTPKIEKRLPKVLNLKQAEKLLDVVDSSESERDIAIITLFLNEGLRLSELINIKLSDIQDDILHVIGKGDKEREIHLNTDCLETIKSYLKIRPKSESDYLFLTRLDDKFSSDGMSKLVKKWLKKAKLNGFSTHKLRHTAASLMYKANGDIRALQELLGHTNISTTEIYTHLDNEQRKKVVDNNPLNHRKGKKLG